MHPRPPGMPGAAGRTGHNGGPVSLREYCWQALPAATHTRHTVAMNSDMQDIAAAAARLIVEDGLDYRSAKQQAVHVLGLPSRTRLPDNDAVEAAVREHIAIFCADTQPGELLALRKLALLWMGRLRPLRPFLTGAVWHGTATRLTDVWLQVFCDDAKAAELWLINHGQRYDVGTTNGFKGESVDVLSLSVPCTDLDEDIGIHLVVYDLDDLKGALRPDSQGRKPRGDEAAVAHLVAASVHELPPASSNV
jgi:hypothetical protein